MVSKAASKNFIERYFDERLDYGGELWTRAEIVRDLRRIGTPERCIDRWLQGAERRKATGHLLMDTSSLTSSIQ